MKILQFHILLKVFSFSIIILLFNSCSQRQFVYLQNDSNTSDETELLTKKLTYKIQVHDILLVTIVCSNKEINDLYTNPAASQSNQGQQISNFYFTGYTVSDSGYIHLPVLGEIQVNNLTLDEATKKITSFAKTFIEDAIVNIKFVNYKILFFGEFGSPGVIIFLQEEVNIFEGILKAGGITDLGNRKEVLVIRPTEKGFKTFRVDLTKRSLLTSEQMYLLPNDMVYAEPLPKKTIKSNINDYFFYITSVTSIVTTLFLVLTYLKK